MSKGFGRIQREIEAILASEPDNGFTINELCLRIYGAQVALKRYRVAVIRAAKRLCQLRPEIGLVRRGRDLALYRRRSVRSYAIANLKSRGCSEHSIQYTLEHDDDRIIEGGQWWIDVHQWIAEHDGNEQLQAQIKPFLEKREMESRAFFAMFKAR